MSEPGAVCLYISGSHYIQAPLEKLNYFREDEVSLKRMILNVRCESRVAGMVR